VSDARRLAKAQSKIMRISIYREVSKRPNNNKACCLLADAADSLHHTCTTTRIAHYCNSIQSIPIRHYYSMKVLSLVALTLTSAAAFQPVAFRPSAATALRITKEEDLELTRKAINDFAKGGAPDPAPAKVAPAKVEEPVVAKVEEPVVAKVEEPVVAKVEEPVVAKVEEEVKVVKKKAAPKKAPKKKKAKKAKAAE
jgi:hypothetical protein